MESHRYDDIINCTHPEPPAGHTRMPAMARAAQFSPFAALTGYDSCIEEEARLTMREALPQLDALEELDRRLQLLEAQAQSRPPVKVIWFVPDIKKAGGEYRTAEGNYLKIDAYTRTLKLTDGTEIPLDRICTLESELLTEAEEKNE